MVCASEGNNPFASNSQIKLMTNTELTLDQLQTVSGGGLLSAGEIADFWIDVLLGGTIKDIKTNADKVDDLDTGVHQQPGTESPRPGVFH